MIAYLKGKLTHKDPAFVIIECGGIGYQVRISLNTYGALGKDEAIQLHTYFMVKEDSQTLFGFKEVSEKQLFEQLISISGVGGNTAMTILSSVSAKELHRAIETEDVAMLKKVKGIGAKTAGRIILELKGKLVLEGEEAAEYATPASAVRAESISALTSLGFPKAQMEKKVDELLKKDPDLSVEDIIKQALRG